MSDQLLYRHSNIGLSEALMPSAAARGLGRCALTVAAVVCLHVSVYWWVTRAVALHPIDASVPSTIAVEFKTSPAPPLSTPSSVASSPAAAPERTLTENRSTQSPAVKRQLAASTHLTPTPVRSQRNSPRQQPTEKQALVRSAPHAASHPVTRPSVEQPSQRVSDASRHGQTLSVQSTPDALRTDQAAADVTLPPKVGRFHTQNPVPEYPMQARRRHMEGLVIIAARINVEGKVAEANVSTSSGHELLDEKALAAVQRWQFEPAQRGTNAVERWLNVPIHFSLH